MKVAKKNYTNAQLELLYGKIEGSMYTGEVVAILKEWAKTGKIERRFNRFSAEQVRQVVHRTIQNIRAQNEGKSISLTQYYVEEVWDAIVEVIKRRKAKAEEKSALLEEVLS